MEWLRYRQPLNNYLLRDTQWIEELIHGTCENFVARIKGMTSMETKGDKRPTKQVDDLEDEIYLWATNCNLFDHLRRHTIANGIYSLLLSWNLVTMNLMVGSLNFIQQQQSDESLCRDVLKFVHISREIMKATAKLNNIPPAIADRWKMKMWKSFENATFESIEFCM